MEGFLVLECDGQTILGGCKEGLPLDESPLILRIYQKSLEALAICADGKISTVEMLCDNILPVERCIEQLFMLQELEISGTCNNKMEMFVACKRGLMAYLLSVLVDTKTEAMLYKLNKPRNGLWLPDENDRKRSVMYMIAMELEVLNEEYYSHHTPPLHLHCETPAKPPHGS